MTDCSSALSARLETHVPTFGELADIFRHALPSNFASVTVDVVPCPDLLSPPFNLTAGGFGGDMRIAEVGGPGNLFPVLHREKAFDITKVCATCDLPAGHAFGPGAGPWPIVGVNSEMIADVNAGEEKARTRIARLDSGSPSGYRVYTLDSPAFSLMANLAVSDGRSGQPVVHVRATRRIGDVNFPEALRRAVAAAFPGRLVSLGGIFIMHSGKAKLHVMPDFPASGCFHDEEEIGAWLRYFEMRAPLVCCTVMHSGDPMQKKLRLEHTHCFSAHGDGGHYHYDTTPDEVDYEAWFAPASAVYRIDEI